jgi:hypothetical protein
MYTCDVCYVAKAAWVAILNRVEDKDLTLYFCNHHYNKNVSELENQGFSVKNI